MAENILTSRIISIHDIEANWKKTINFIPRQGEIVIYDMDDNHTFSRIKIGDGVTTVNDLPFSVEVALENYLSLSHDIGYIDGGNISEY